MPRQIIEVLSDLIMTSFLSFLPPLRTTLLALPSGALGLVSTPTAGFPATLRGGYPPSIAVLADTAHHF
jgi:hypothetical protein